MAEVGFLYTSERAFHGTEADEVIERIVEWSTGWNRSRGVTGSLIHTGNRFAQRLEGEEPEIEYLIGNISRDVRHLNVRVADKGPISTRSYPSWSMAYSGRSTFIEDRVSRIAEAPDVSASKQDVDALIGVMLKFDRPNPTEG